MGKGKFEDRDMQQIIGTLLRYGVLVSFTITLVGGITYLLQHGGDKVPDYSKFLGLDSDYASITSIFNGLLRLDVQGIIQFAVMVLIATPILRVAMSLIAFALEKDKLYVIISSIVLGIIVASLLSGLKL